MNKEWWRKEDREIWGNEERMILIVRKECKKEGNIKEGMRTVKECRKELRTEGNKKGKKEGLEEWMNEWMKVDMNEKKAGKLERSKWGMWEGINKWRKKINM